MPLLAVPLVWLLLAGLLLAIELSLPGFDGLMVAVLGALSLSVLTALLPLPLWLQIGLFILITVAGTLWLSSWSARRTPSSSRRRLKEDTAEVLGTITPGGEGRVRWRGQSWAASSLDLEQPLEAGVQVLVMGRDGTQLQILPINALR